MGSPTPFPKQLTRPDISRGQILATTLFAFLVYVIVSRVPLPFDKKMGGLALASGFFHLGLFILFNKIFPIRPVPYSFMSLFNYILLGFFIHYSGGILSPFVFVFFFILISDSANANNFISGLTAALIVYLAVVGSEYFGFLDPVAISTKDIYASPPATVLVVGSVVMFLVIVGQAYKVIILGLRKKLELEHEHTEKTRRELIKLDATSQLGLVVNKIVHDIRGPLGAVSGFIGLIQNENKLTPESNEDCEVMLKELGRISNMLNRLIKYAKPGRMEKTMVCPVDLMETVLSVFAFYPGAQRVQIDRQFPEPNLMWIYATKEELQQVVFNILKNAVEALEKSDWVPKIHCTVSSDVLNVYIEIRDNGVGIPQNILANLLKAPLSTKSEGGGVGLSIVKEILEAYGGDLKINSEEGVGTAVVIQLPRYSKDDQKIKKGMVLQPHEHENKNG